MVRSRMVKPARGAALGVSYDTLAAAVEVQRPPYVSAKLLTPGGLTACREVGAVGTVVGASCGTGPGARYAVRFFRQGIGLLKAPPIRMPAPRRYPITLPA